MATLKRDTSPGLPEADLMLAVFGPWHPRTQCESTPTPLWHPRVETARLRALWSNHEPAIREAAAAAGVTVPWIADRLQFCELLGE